MWVYFYATDSFGFMFYFISPQYISYVAENLDTLLPVERWVKNNLIFYLRMPT